MVDRSASTLLPTSPRIMVAVISQLDNYTPSSGRWVRLDEYFESKRKELRSRRLVERLMRRDLSDGRLPYRYLDGEGRQHQDDLSADFWIDASFNLDELSASCVALEVYYIEVLVPAELTALPPAADLATEPAYLGGAPLRLVRKRGRQSAADMVRLKAKRRIEEGEVVPTPSVVILTLVSHGRLY
jgi:hypothetical protein